VQLADFGRVWVTITINKGARGGIMGRVRKSFFVMLPLAVALCFGSVAQAQDSGFVVENVPNIFGIGAGIAPDYQGSDDYTFGALPFGRYTFENTERYVQLIGAEVYLNVLDHPVYRLGPLLNYRFGRDDDVEDDVVKLMEEIDDTIEGGVFAGLTFIDPKDSRKRFLTSVELLTDLGGNHDGSTISFSARYWHPLSKSVDITIGGGFTYADDDYMSTYFGVSNADSARTGLPVFNAGGGIKSFRIIPGVMIHLSRSWHVGGGLRYQLLLSDASDSPVTDDRGSDTQIIATVAVAYSW
jgi:outer membrane protein